MKKTILYSLICTAAIAAGCALITKLKGWGLSGFCYCMIMAGLAACVIGVGFTPGNRSGIGRGYVGRGGDKLILDSWQMEGKKRQNDTIDFLYIGGALSAVLGFLIEVLF